MNLIKTNKIAALVILMTILTFNILAQELGSKENNTEISLEIDPATFVFNGYGFHIRLKPQNSNHLLFGLGTYAMDMPDILIELNSNNKDKGWDVRLNQAYGLFGEYHFEEVNKKWFVGEQISIQEYKISNDIEEGNKKFSNLLLMTYGGYTWKPFSSNFYIKPWAGIAYTSKISGDNNHGNLEYDIAPILMFATLHIGYTF